MSSILEPGGEVWPVFRWDNTRENGFYVFVVNFLKYFNFLFSPEFSFLHCN